MDIKCLTYLSHFYPGDVLLDRLRLRRIMGRAASSESLWNVMIETTQLVTQLKSPPFCDIKVIVVIAIIPIYRQYLNNISVGMIDRRRIAVLLFLQLLYIADLSFSSKRMIVFFQRYILWAKRYISLQLNDISFSPPRYIVYIQRGIHATQWCLVYTERYIVPA